MSAISIATEAALARDIKEKLALEFPSVALTETYDSNGYPVINFGTITASGGGAVIRVKPSDDVSGIDSLGLTQRVYEPHLVQACLEESATADVFVMTSVTWSKVEKILNQAGCKTQVFMSDNGVAPSTGSMTGSAAITLWPDVYNKQKQQQ